MNLQLLIIDPQNDFTHPKGSLFVPGANDDCVRLAAMIRRLGSKIDDIHTTLDSHHVIDIAHPVFWKSQTGQHPTPFTIITAADVASGLWTPVHPGFYDYCKSYTATLESNGRYPLCIWPEHCLIGSWGYAVDSDVFGAIREWEFANFAIANYVTKGSNFKTEHYSAVQADVPDPADPGTQLNTGLIQVLQSADVIGIAGQALSHCVANTIRDIAANFGEENIKKFVLLKDCTSNVPGFEGLGSDFIAEMTSRGMQVSDSVSFFA